MALTYKVKERYAFGFTDPRAVSGSRAAPANRTCMDPEQIKEAMQIPTETLQYLWLTRFGRRATVEQIEDAENYEFWYIAYKRLKDASFFEFIDYDNTILLREPQ